MDMFFTQRKLEGRIRELGEYRYRDVRNFESFLAKEDKSGLVNPDVPTDFTGWDRICTGSDWKGRDLYLWLHGEMKVPAEWEGKRAVGVFDFGMTGGGNNSGFESLLFVNGEQYQAVDANHKEVFFRPEICGNEVSLTFRLWSGLEGGGLPREMEHRLKSAFLGYLDEKTDDLYYLGLMVWKTIEELSENDPVRHNLQAALDRAFLKIDWSYPGSDDFYASVAEADDCLNAAIDAMDKHSDIHVYTVGHTHIDTAWLWRLKNTREKCGRSFTTVMRLMEMFPEYDFLQTQPQLYEWVKEDYPELYSQIRDRVAEGRWEADGAMWVEADCNLTSGESLTRQILIGSKFIKDEFGKEVEFLWLPDVFGYSWALPQILKKAGIDMFMTTKISWNQYNRMPHDTFYWKGIDGSKVLTHFITTPEPGRERDSWFYTYNGLIEPRTVKGIWDGYSEKEMNHDLLLSYGYGDGGGGVNRDMLEQRRRLDKIPGLPHVETTTAGKYFRKLKETVAKTDRYVNTWDGELYLEYHRGTYTSQARNKKNNRKTELKLREAEWLVSEAAVKTGDFSSYPEKELQEAWKIALRNQFHDIIPGSSIHEVYEDSAAEYAKANEILDTIEKNALKVLVRESDSIVTVVNNSSFAGEGIVTVKVKTYEGRKGSWFSADGKELPAVYTEDGWLVKVSGIEPAGFTTLTLIIGTRAECFCTEEWTGELDTPFYHIVWDEKGRMTSIFDKENDREILKAGELGNHLVVYEDRPMKYDAWDIDIYYQEKGYEVEDLKTVSVEKSSLMTKVKMDWNYQDSTISQEIRFYNDNRRIDFVTHADWHEHQQLLRVLFPLDIRTSEATFDIQYGNVKRPTYENTSWDIAKFETVAHQ